LKNRALYPSTSSGRAQRVVYPELDEGSAVNTVLMLTIELGNIESLTK